MTNTIRRRDIGFFMGDNAIFDRHDLSVYEKIVYIYLCRRADSESRAWPSYDRIAQDCGISRDTAMRAVAKLVEKGLLEGKGV
ncbi:Helix-turn-helix domain-containing protein [Desulforamulus putei DSM 12395]|uniref:Helix-turn-helix domain-containing protein n=1 Tax=Desulforamulus putei DSM 12395 TaxID=1121429 RepID=A0A1M4URY7_9FIRM|nr:helix-turn-helix domain-containing protein [Desulforamulus putei]SHE59476.1 Helix-turn-helix domain-containing protein [Desulforamulus putei DSM 12395]